MSKSFKNIGIAVLSVLMAVCLTIGLTIFFKQSPIVTAASVNSEVHTVIADEDDFTYGKTTKSGHNYVYVAGLSPSFTEKYKKGGEQNTDGQKTFNVCLEIPATLTAERNGIPAGTKIDYVNHDAFVDEYYEEDDVITLRITDVHTPQTVFWYEPTDGVFKLANYDTASPLENKTVTSVSDANAKTWAKMLGTDDGVTATVYDMDLAKLKANFIVPSPMWYDNNKDGVMDNNELFLNVELLVDEQPKSDKVENGSLLRNMVISSGVTRFFSPLEKANRIKIEDTFRTANGASGSYLTGLHFATGRTSVLSIYGLAFQRFTHLETITLSAGVLLADGVRAFQGDNSVAVMDIAKENNSNVPSFYVKGDKGAIYTGDYRYSYYDTAGYRKWIVWDYVTRTGKRLGDQAFWDNTADNGDYNLQVEKDYDTTYTVTFDLNGAPGENFTREVKKNRLVPTVTDPVWEGYSFAGWYTSAQGGSKWNFETGTITGDTTLYAHWVKDIALSNGYFDSYGVDGNGWFADGLGYDIASSYSSKTINDGKYYNLELPSADVGTSSYEINFDDGKTKTFQNSFECKYDDKKIIKITPQVDMYLGGYLSMGQKSSEFRVLQLRKGSTKDSPIVAETISLSGQKAAFVYLYEYDKNDGLSSIPFLLKANQTYTLTGSHGTGENNNTGVYRLTLHIAGWTDETNGAHTVYPEATVDYTITVRLAEMAEVNDGDLTKYAETPFSTPYNGEVQIPDISGVTNGITYDMRTGTAWSDGKYDEYFDASAPIEFSMSSGINADYSELGEFKSKEGAPKNVILKTVDYVKRENTRMYAEDDYTVSYMFSATNYNNYYRSFKVKITQVELELALEGTSTGKVKVDGNTVVWTANSALRKTDLTFNFKNVIESDKEDIVLRYAFYNKSDSSFTTAMDRSDTSAFSEYPQIAGDYLWRFTFENWNDAGNLNNNYKLKIASEDNVLFETKGGVTYAKPYVLFNVTVSPEAITAGDLTVGDSREATYTGSKLTYLTNDEADTFTETPVGDEQFINVKVDASGNVVYYEAYIVITDKNYAWPEEFKSSHDIDDQGRLKVQFKINPAEVTVNWTVKQGSSEIFAPYVYNAHDYTASAKAVWKKNGVDTTVSFALADGGKFKTVNQDGYTFTVNLADIDNSFAANFKLVSGELSKTFTVEPYVITKEQVDRALSYETTKEYDGKTTVNLNSSLVTLAINGENPKFSVDSISYNSANVKEASTITIGIGLTGDAVNSNYKLFGETYTVDGKITAKELTADDFTGMAISKVYDGTAAVDVGKHVTKGVLNGISGETVEFTVVSAEYDEANAGERKVTVTIALDNEPNYILGETEIVIGGTITRARLTVTYGGRPAYGYTGNDIWKDTISTKFTATVNSTAAIPTIIYTVLHNGEPVEGNVIKDVGRYAITAQLDTVYTTNYEIAGAVGGVVTVTQINITGNVIERIEWSGEATYIYNGKNFTKPVAVALLTNGDSVELEVEGSVDCTVGKYTFAVVENSDYIFDDSLAKQFTVTVKPATVTIEKAVFTETYNGKAHSPEIRLNWSEGVLDESLYELIGTTAVNAGKYDYKVKLLSDNYTFLRGNTTSVSLTVVAARVNIAETEFEALYTGEIQKLPELRLTWSGGELSANNYTVSGDEAINAGTYVYSVTLKSGNFTFAGGKDAKVTFVIEKVTVEKPLATNAEYVYDGSEHTYNVAESEYYSVSNATRTDAGTQTVRISLKDKRNYVWADGSSADVKFGFTVEKAQAHVTVGEINAVEYDGESHGIPAPQTESWVENTVVTYNGYAVEPINAGSYAIVVTVPETENYYGATVSGKTLVINKKALTVSWNSSTSFVEDGTAKTPYNGVSGAPENSIAVTYSANGVTLIGAPAGAGEYTVTVKLLSTDNYVLNGETTRTFSISSQQSEQPPVVESGTGENENFDALWYTLVAVSAVALAFAAVSTVIYIKRNKV